MHDYFEMEPFIMLSDNIAQTMFFSENVFIEINVCIEHVEPPLITYLLTRLPEPSIAKFRNRATSTVYSSRVCEICSCYCLPGVGLEEDCVGGAEEILSSLGHRDLQLKKQHLA